MGTRLVDLETPRGKGMLRLWPLPLAGDWSELVIEPPIEAELAGVRRSVKPRSSYGGPTWQQERARTMALEATLRPLERPKKKSNVATQEQQE